ncbi:hypothetical protein CDAR_369371 [Caerostris darwini]|uniref:Uncharacterized protein n=1 Tax=Caerostris darwini TaxID=1538125 RepID=A0AAV4S0S9_9ARAC|nr:hypothetical protein CDAR_369371 [Caerostris darwini]
MDERTQRFDSDGRIHHFLTTTLLGGQGPLISVKETLCVNLMSLSSCWAQGQPLALLRTSLPDRKCHMQIWPTLCTPKLNHKDISKIKRLAEEELWYTHLLFVENPQSNIKSISPTSSIRLLTHPASEIRQWHDERSSGSSSTNFSNSSLRRIISKRCLQMKDLALDLAETKPRRHFKDQTVIRGGTLVYAFIIRMKSISPTSSIRLLTHPASEIRQWHGERSSGSSSTNFDNETRKIRNPISNPSRVCLSPTSSIRLLTHPASEIRQWHGERSSGSFSTNFRQRAPSSLRRIISKLCLQTKDLAVYAETKPQRHFKDQTVRRGETLIYLCTPKLNHKDISKIKRSAEEELWYTPILFVENPQSNIKSISPTSSIRLLTHPADEIRQWHSERSSDLAYTVYAETKPQRHFKDQTVRRGETLVYAFIIRRKSAIQYQIHLSHHQQYPAIDSSCERNPALAWLKIFWFVFDKLQATSPEYFAPNNFKTLPSNERLMLSFG